MVQNYVWRLRKVIAADGGAEIVTRGRAYELQIDRELIDALRFERLVGEATRGGSGDAARQALALYRGEPLADIASEPFAGAEIRRLEELRLTAAELAVDADLAAGRHQEVARRDRRAAGREPAARAPARAADARAVPLRAPGGRARGLPGGARDAGRARSASSRARAAAPAGRDPAPGPGAGRRGGRARVPARARGRGRAADDRPRARAAGLRRRWRRRRAGHARRRVRDGQDAARGRARARGPRATARACSTPPGSGPAEVALAAIARAAESRRPALLVLDDADRAPTPRSGWRCSRSPERRGARAGHGSAGRGAGAPGAARGARARAARRRGGRRHRRRSMPRPAATSPSTRCCATSRGVARRVHEAASEWARRAATERVDALAGRTAAGRSEARALESELAGERRRAAVDARADRGAARERAGGLPIQGPRELRPRRRRVLLRSRGARGGAGRAPGRRAAAGRRRPVRERQVVGRARRAAARAGGRRAAGQPALVAGGDPARRAPGARAAPGWRRTTAACSSSTSSRSCSRPARTSASGPSSSPRCCGFRASWWPCARTSTAAARPTRSSRARSATTTCSSGR